MEFGDFFEGKSKLERLRTLVYLKSLEKIRYDALSIHASSLLGNREFLKVAMETTSIPFLSLNTYDADTGKPIGEPFIIKDLGNLKIALVGLTDPLGGSTGQADSLAEGHNTNNIMGQSSEVGVETYSQGVDIVDPHIALEKHLPEIKAQSDFIILLSDLASEQNKEIANRFPEIRVLLGTDPKGESGLFGSTFIVNNESVDGKKIGKLSVVVDAKGNLIKTGIEWLPIRKTFVENREVRTILDDFYNEVAGNEAFWEDIKPLFASLEIEADADNRFVGALECASCHEEIYAGWEKSKHAGAYFTLVKANMYYYPDCISCHTTGAGYGSGFKIDQSTKHLEGVQCEVCHGPGSRHLTSEGEFNLRLQLDKKFCGECHKDEFSPEFGAHFENMLTKVNHSYVLAKQNGSKTKIAGKPGNYQNLKRLKGADRQLFERLYEELAAGCPSNHLLFECKGKSARAKRIYLDSLLEHDRDFDSLMAKMIEKYGEGIRSTEKERARYKLKRQTVTEAVQVAIKDTGKASIELFVVSYGSNAIKAEKILFKLKDRMSAGAVELRLRFIADEAEPEPSSDADKTAGDSIRFTSHNGQREVEEDMRQLLIQQYYPEKLGRYLLVRNTSITTTNWKECARVAGIDPKEITWRVANGEGGELLARDIRLIKSLKIGRSPTLLINGKKFLGKFVE